VADDQTPFELTEVEQALVDGMKTLLEFCMMVEPASRELFLDSFTAQRDGCLQKQQPKAAALFEMLRLFLADPKRAQERQRAQSFLKEPPAGSA
jgi:hypothetical protein